MMICSIVYDDQLPPISDAEVEPAAVDRRTGETVAHLDDSRRPSPREKENSEFGENSGANAPMIPVSRPMIPVSRPVIPSEALGSCCVSLLISPAVSVSA